MDIFKLFGTIAVENDEANRAIDETTGIAEKSESRMSSAFKKIGAAVATYFAVDKIIDFGQACVDMSAEVAAEQSAFEQIMGDYSDAAQEKVNEIADATGMVDTRLTPYMTSMTAKFKGLGYDIGDATDYAQQGLTIAADAAAFWDKSLDDSMSALNSFVNGSYEGGEAIGLFANDTQMAAYAVKTGLISESKEWANLDEKIKQATRLEYAENMQKASGAVGQAAKESGQYANVQANLNEKWRQFKAQVGEPILQDLVLPAMEKLSGFITDKLMPGVEKFTDYLSEDLIPMFWETCEYLAEELSPILSDIGEAIKELLPPVMEIIKSALPVVVNLVKKLVPILVDALRVLTPILNIIPPIIDALAPLIDVIATVAKGVGIATAGFVAFFEQGLGLIPGMVEKTVDEFSRLDEEEQELADRISELTDEYDSWAKSRDELLSDTGAEFDYYQQLSDELQTLTDKNGKVKEGYEDRAAFIVGTLNDSLGTEIEMTDGVIENYEELVSAIDEVIEKKKAEAMLSAYEQTYTEAVANVTEAQEAYLEQIEKVNAIKGEMVAVQSALNDLEHMSADEIYRAYGASADYATVSQDLKGKLEGLNNQLETQETDLNDAKNAYFEFNSAIQNYEGLSSAIISGDTTAINDSLVKMTEGFLTAETADAESLERQTYDLKTEINNMKAALANGMPGVTQEHIDQLENLYNESSKEWQKALGDVHQFTGDVKNELNVDYSTEGSNAMASWGNGAVSAAQSVITTLSGLRDTFSSLMSGYSVNVSASELVASTKKLTGHAKGGIVTREHIARVGEDGAEAIVPLENNTEWIDKVAAKFTASMGGAPSNSAILSKLTELIEVIKEQKVYLDSGVLVGEIAPAMDSELGNISRMKRRGLR